jgi:hypothetical protein
VSVPWKPQKKSRSDRERDKRWYKNGTRPTTGTSNSIAKTKPSSNARATVEVIDAKLLVDNPFDVDNNNSKRTSDVCNGVPLGDSAPPVDGNRSRAGTVGSVPTQAGR